MQQYQLNKLIRGQYKDILSVRLGGLLSSARFNNFLGGSQGSPLRDNIYRIGADGGPIYCSKPCYVEAQILGAAIINNIIVRFYDNEYVLYDIIVTVGYNNIENIVFQSTNSQNVIKIQIPTQKVNYVKIINNNGNQITDQLFVMKIQAFYSL